MTIRICRDDERDAILSIVNAAAEVSVVQFRLWAPHRKQARQGEMAEHRSLLLEGRPQPPQTNEEPFLLICRLLQGRPS